MNASSSAGILEELAALLPPGFRAVPGRRGLLGVQEDLADALQDCGFGPEGGEDLPDSDLAGRHPLQRLRVGEEEFLVRRFHHGGLFRGLGTRAYLDPRRPFEELALSARLAELGVSTVSVVAARASRDRPAGWQLAVVSRRVPDSQDGAAVLERIRAGHLGGKVRRDLFRAAGALVGELHRVQFLHADLNPRNLLFPAEPGPAPQVTVLDLDRSRFVDELAAGARRDNLRRLLRSVLRREARGTPFLSRGDVAAFLRAYDRARGAAPGSWKEDWRAILRRSRRRGVLHRVGWFLEERLGSGPGARDGKAVLPRPPGGESDS